MKVHETLGRQTNVYVSIFATGGVLYKKGVLGNFKKFTGKQLRQRLF